MFKRGQEMADRLSPDILESLKSYIETHFIPPVFEEAEVSEIKAPARKKENKLFGFLGAASNANAVMFTGAGKCAARESAPMEMAPMEDADAYDARSLEDVVRNISDTWQESLFRIIDEKGLADTDVYKKAGIDRKLFSKIRSNKDYKPKKDTAVALALALELNLDETRDILGRAGYALSPSSISDLIIEYFITNEIYDLYTINLALFEHKQPLLSE